MKKNKVKQIIFFVGILLTIGALFLGVPMITTNVIGANITNATTVAKVYVWNTEPNITRVVVNPSPTIDLAPGNTTEVNCTGYVYDWNSWSDIRNVSASFYYTNEGDGTTTDNNYRYINTSCGNATTACTEISANNASCTCSFDVWYYANSGTWQCNMTITDAAGNATERFYYFNDSETSSTVTINTVLGIGTADEIDYGNLSITEISNNITANVTNLGNIPINISVRGWGGTEDYSAYYNDTNMICQYGNITRGYQRYSPNMDEVYANMLNLTNTSTMMSAFTIKSKNDTGAEAGYNLTYWRLEVPYTVGGTCNGTIEFAASDAS